MEIFLAHILKKGQKNAHHPGHHGDDQTMHSLKAMLSSRVFTVVVGVMMSIFPPFFSTWVRKIAIECFSRFSH